MKTCLLCLVCILCLTYANSLPLRRIERGVSPIVTVCNNAANKTGCTDNSTNAETVSGTVSLGNQSSSENNTSGILSITFVNSTEPGLPGVSVSVSEPPTAESTHTLSTDTRQPETSSLGKLTTSSSHESSSTAIVPKQSTTVSSEEATPTTKSAKISSLSPQPNHNVMSSKSSLTPTTETDNGNQAHPTPIPGAFSSTTASSVIYKFYEDHRNALNIALPVVCGIFGALFIICGVCVVRKIKNRRGYRSVRRPRSIRQMSNRDRMNLLGDSSDDDL